MRVNVAHETIGRNSRPIGMNGYFNFLAPKVGPVEQYAEWDSVSWHACEWNRWGVGMECERFQGEWMTEDQVLWIAYTIAWINYLAGGGVPLTLRDGPRLLTPDIDPYRGWANHRTLVIRRCDPHSDWWDPEEWAWILSKLNKPEPTPPQEVEMRSMLIHKPGDLTIYVYDPASGTKAKIANSAVFDGMKFLAGKTGLDVGGPHNGVYEVNADFLDGLIEIAPVVNVPGTPTPGPSLSEIKAAMRQELNTTKLGPNV